MHFRKTNTVILRFLISKFNRTRALICVYAKIFRRILKCQNRNIFLTTAKCRWKKVIFRVKGARWWSCIFLLGWKSTKLLYYSTLVKCDNLFIFIFFCLHERYNVVIWAVVHIYFVIRLAKCKQDMQIWPGFFSGFDVSSIRLDWYVHMSTLSLSGIM